ncbi:MAG: metallopeptidase family protein [Actinomycetota bacterium]
MRFDDLVAEALDALPEWVLDRMENVEVLVEDHPPADEPDLLGRYDGVPLAERGADYGFVLPDTITLFRRPIERVAGSDPDALRREITQTVVHEVAHHFGISDDRLHDLDAY